MAGMPALTRDEARARRAMLDVHHYAIDLDLTDGSDVFRSVTTIRFSVIEPGDTFVELKPATIHRITLDGRDVEPAALADNRLPLPGFTSGEHTLTIDAHMSYSHTGEGLHRFTDPADGQIYLYTQLFLDDVQRVFAAFDQPDLKAVFDVTVTAPEAWTVLGNGIATQQSPGRWTIATTPKISTYLVAIAAGPWHSVRTEHAGLPFGLHCRQSLAPHLDKDADELFEITRQCFDRYADKFTEPYPFDSYDQTFVPEFNAGAMENPGLVTFRDEFVYRSAVTDTERQTRAMVIAHEMAHMWFGDLVTLEWWDDIWLNESFAEYMGYQTVAEATRFADPWVDFAIGRKGWGYDADQRPSTHPVAPDDVPDTGAALTNFDGISYAKGASALRQLVVWLGEDAFLAGVNDHFARHRFGNATLADFIESMDRASDRDAHGWADQWLRTSGVDTLRLRVEHTADKWTPIVEREGDRPHRLLVGGYDGAAEGLAERERFEVDVPGPAVARTGHRPALVMLNDDDLTYAKIRFDPESWSTIERSLRALPSPLTRAVLWNAARDMVRDAELSPAIYLDMAARHLAGETDLAIVQGVLQFTRGAVADQYLHDAQRATALEALTGISTAMLDGFDEPGLRLSAARALIGSAATPDTIRAWFEAGAVPGGPELDPELRWQILHRLAVLGAVTPDEITAELARDTSAKGEEGKARCLAALPDASRKAAAWSAMFDGDDLSAYLFNATMQGFWAPEQRDLVAAYVPRYFEDAVAMAGRRGPSLGMFAGHYGFPSIFVTDETLQLGEQCLADGDPIPMLRRQLIDRMDDLRRALRIRSSFDHLRWT
jgi:aminopeptidase N